MQGQPQGGRRSAGVPVAWGAGVVAVHAKCDGETERNDFSCARVIACKYPFLQSVFLAHLVQIQI